MRLLIGTLVGLVVLSGTSGLAAEPAFVSADVISENSVAMGQWVQADSEGSVRGVIYNAGLSGAGFEGSIVLRSPQGEKITGDVDDAGNFRIPSVAPGVYSLIYKGESLFAALALHVLESSSENGEGRGAIVPAAALDPKRAIATIARYQPARLPQEIPAEGSSIEPAFSVSETPTGIASVMRNVDGGMSGRLVCAGMTEQGAVAASGLNVLVLKDGVVRAQVVSDSEGSFTTEQLEPGSYGLIISGAMGYAAIGIELIEAPEILTALRGSRVSKLASVRRSSVAMEVVLQVAGPDPTLGSEEDSSAPAVVSEALPTTFESGATAMNAAPATPAGGNAAVGGGGGGGSFGGGGGFGGLAGVGAVIAALAGEDNGGFVPSVTSPATP